MTRYATSLFGVASLLLFLSFLAGQSEGHGVLTYPVSRQFRNRIENRDYCPHCKTAGGPAVVAGNNNGKWPWPETKATSKRAGLCGDVADGPQVYLHGGEMDPGTIEATFKAGTEVTFEILMHAHHRGVFEFSICDLKDVDNGQETFECFNRHRLMRSPNDDSVSPIDPLYPKRYYLEPYCAFETYTKAIDGSKPAWDLVGGRPVRMKYMLPDDLECEHCTLRWWWYTANSCNPPGFQTMNFPKDCTTYGWAQLNIPECGTSLPEEFWNCADIRILPADGSGYGPPATTTTTTTVAPVTSEEEPQVCQNKKDKCHKCKNSKDCKKCTKKHYLHNGRCVPSCPTGFEEVGKRNKGRFCKKDTAATTPAPATTTTAPPLPGSGFSASSFSSCVVSVTLQPFQTLNNGWRAELDFDRAGFQILTGLTSELTISTMSARRVAVEGQGKAKAGEPVRFILALAESACYSVVAGQIGEPGRPLTSTTTTTTKAATTTTKAATTTTKAATTTTTKTTTTTPKTTTSTAERTSTTGTRVAPRTSFATSADTWLGGCNLAITVTAVDRLPAGYSMYVEMAHADFSIGSSWGARQLDRNGAVVTFEAYDWNAPLEAGDSIEFNLNIATEGDLCVGVVAAGVGSGPGGPAASTDSTTATTTTATTTTTTKRAGAEDSTDAPLSTSRPVFRSRARRLEVNGQALNLRGTNWFGLETDVLAPHGCWNYPSADACFTFFLDFLAAEGFNALRVPLAMDSIQSNPTVTDYPFNGGIRYLKLVDQLVEACAQRGILVMLDIHRVRAKGDISPLWYEGAYKANTNAQIKAGFQKLIDRYADDWNVFALDLTNEPYGATWGDNKAATDWRLAAEDLGQFVLDSAAPWLVFVAGVGNEYVPGADTTYNHFWGQNMQGVRQNPINVEPANRLVYTPHVYGPGVFMMDYFTDPSFPDNMEAIWDLHFGFVAAQTGRAVVLGEWGGPNEAGTLDATYHTALAAYLKSRGMTSNFYWCLNPNSGDTGGLLQDDWKTGDRRKLNLLKDLVASPTKFDANGNLV